MRALSSTDLLDLWDRGYGLHPLDQGLLVLGAALPETTYETLADWPLGRRNEALAELRCACFGPRFEGWTACPACREMLEFEVDGRMFKKEAEDDPDTSVVVNGNTFRLPTVRDLASVANETEPHLAAIRLVESCRLGGDRTLTWTEDDLEEVGQKMSLADPMADILLTLHCPLCGHESKSALDLVTFLWSEIEARVKHLLFEVHTLASAYGWTQSEILSLSEHRRSLYLEAVQA